MITGNGVSRSILKRAANRVVRGVVDADALRTISHCGISGGIQTDIVSLHKVATGVCLGRAKDMHASEAVS